MRPLLTCPQGQVSGEKGRRHLLTRPWGRISATPHKTWVFPLTCPSSFLRPWGNSWLALSVTSAPCQRLGCRLGRPLGNVPPGRSGPEGRAKSRLPLWGRCPPKEGGEGTPLARGPAFGKPPSWHSAVREKRFAVSLAFFPALRAHKGKTVGRWSHLPVRSAQGVCHRQTAPHTLQAF